MHYITVSQISNHTFAKENIPVKSGEVNVKWDDIPEHKYALAIYRDIDHSSSMKTNMFGYPKEPFAFSNNYKPTLSSPKFDQCKILFNGTNNRFKFRLID